jgi:hypothetical protein
LGTVGGGYGQVAHVDLPRGRVRTMSAMDHLGPDSTFRKGVQEGQQHANAYLAGARLRLGQINDLENFRTTEFSKSDGSGAAAQAVHQQIFRQSIFGTEAIEDSGIHRVRE